VFNYRSTFIGGVTEVTSRVITAEAAFSVIFTEATISVYIYRSNVLAVHAEATFSGIVTEVTSRVIPAVAAFNVIFTEATFRVNIYRSNV